MLANVFCGAITGVDASLVEVEVDIASGLPAFTTVGLPETTVRESRERVKSAIKNSGYPFPDDRITVNLAPAHIKKEGTGFDLPVALGILCATGIIEQHRLDQLLFLGELSLDGRIKPVFGALPMALAARTAARQGIIVPLANRHEAAVVSDIAVYGAETLADVVAFLRNEKPIEITRADANDLCHAPVADTEDFAEVKGQSHVKRALEIAAAGGHNVLMVGPPGSGKTMLARRLPTILPPMTFEEAIETTKIYSVVGMLSDDQALIHSRPFRAPHHTVSDAGLIGGGAWPRPGEVSLAHHGVLFLDELPEYKKHVLEVMRQPLEDGQVTLSRASTTLTYPARFMLVAAMNPCPCGYLTDDRHDCRCTPSQIQRYVSRISGPLMDRIDIHVEVPAIAYRDLSGAADSEPSTAILQRVVAARKRQRERLADTRIHSNAQMGNRLIKSFCQLTPAANSLLANAIDRLGFSARAYHRILKIARTIADLDNRDDISVASISEAIQYRMLDRRLEN